MHISYSNVNHQKLDWVGIHEQICSTLLWVRKPVTMVCPEEERRKKMEEIRSTRVDYHISLHTSNDIFNYDFILFIISDKNDRTSEDCGNEISFWREC